MYVVCMQVWLMKTEKDEEDGGAPLCVLATASSHTAITAPTRHPFFTLRVPISLVVLAATRGY